ncbi:GntR family transcriptional regulator [Chitinophaga caseinilytica]|uniref:GntR family transcriptional regulator n=1 Tax=Chitinophaga caseinilytica TaxID=2267521 RepID=UPI003C2CF2D0
MKAESQSGKVYEVLRSKILANQVIPGSRLKEDDWAARAEVSRVSVREALNRLLGEGLLEKGARGGYFVKSMTEDRLREVREVRELLEIGALRLAGSRLTAEDIASLEVLCEDFSAMVVNGYWSGACEADIRFHETLIGISRNSKLRLLYELSNIPLFHLKRGPQASQMDDYEETDREHREIVRWLKAGKPARAQEVLSRHLHRGEMAAKE